MDQRYGAGQEDVGRLVCLDGVGIHCDVGTSAVYGRLSYSSFLSKKLYLAALPTPTPSQAKHHSQVSYRISTGGKISSPHLTYLLRFLPTAE